MKPENPYDNTIDRSVGQERAEIWQEGCDKGYEAGKLDGKKELIEEIEKLNVPANATMPFAALFYTEEWQRLKKLAVVPEGK